MGPVVAVYVPSQSSDAYLDRLDGILQGRTTHLQPTRRGRVWDAWFGGAHGAFTIPIHICVESTLDGLPRMEAEDDLHELGLRPDDFPIRVLLGAMCNGSEDWSMIRTVSEEIRSALSGVATEPEK